MTTATKAEKAVGVAATLGMFDDRSGEEILRIHHEGVPLADVKPLAREAYRPQGMTPLNDATAIMIHRIERLFAERPDQIHMGFLIDESGSMQYNRDAVIEGYNEFVEPLRAEVPKGDGRVMLVIMTDGQENASTDDRDGSKVRALVRQKEDEGWVFLYLGANQDAWAAAERLGVKASPGQAANFTSSPVGTANAMRTAARTRGVGYIGDLGAMGKESYLVGTQSLGDTINEDGSLGNAPTRAQAERERAERADQLRKEQDARLAKAKEERQSEVHEAVDQAKELFRGPDEAA